ncbi:hypothetical protein [Hymenobacter siberiensis]|uniref:hypothetical protein n=1 Tax=Hymenobacter siberiensis TaxID=2848396 RepID=UPI001C1E060B|nr:hypothetical protein [Hymenobacter siberiensis]
MKYAVNLQYRPEDKERPQDEPMLDASGQLLDLVFDDAGLLPNIGDHVLFYRAGGEYDTSGTYVSKTKQVEGIVEHRLFVFMAKGIVDVNIVVTDSKIEFNKLIKQ